jgi:hypothetical protein
VQPAIPGGQVPAQDALEVGVPGLAGEFQATRQPQQSQADVLLFALMLDPSLILSAQGLAPDPCQRDLLLSTDNSILLCCSRQAGKSTTVAALAVHTALFRVPALTLILSPSQRQSGETLRKIKDAYNALGRPAGAVVENQSTLELANGSRVVCLPGKEATVRSFSAVDLLILDEAARVADDLYRTVRPMLAVSSGRLIALSTPFGKRGFFIEEWDREPSAFKKVRITWRQCPRIADAFIAEKRRSLGEAWVRQEYEFSFEALEGLVYAVRPGADRRRSVLTSVNMLLSSRLSRRPIDALGFGPRASTPIARTAPALRPHFG